MNKEYVFVGNAQNKTRDFIDQLIKENKDLQHQLKEKEKIIDDNFKKIKHIYNMLNNYKENHIICFDKDLWGLYQRMNKELLTILE